MTIRELFTVLDTDAFWLCNHNGSWTEYYEGDAAEKAREDFAEVEVLTVTPVSGGADIWLAI